MRLPCRTCSLALRLGFSYFFWVKLPLRIWLIGLWLSILVLCFGLAGLLVYLFQGHVKAQLTLRDQQLEVAAGRVAEQVERLQPIRGAAPIDFRSEALREELTALVSAELKPFAGVEGGLWNAQAGFIGYAFPTYPGTGVKRDVPEAEQPQIIELALRALQSKLHSTIRHEGKERTLVLHTRPLGDPKSGLVVWTMSWVHHGQGEAYAEMRLGLVMLCLLALSSGLWMLWLVQRWSRQVRHLEQALAHYSLEDLPPLAELGDPDLDRVIQAFNRMRERLRQAREHAQKMGQELARAERLSVLGRMAAGMAHEIRNPIASMRLKAENALGQPPQRMQTALEAILGQVQRLDDLLQRLLALTRQSEVRVQPVQIAPWLDSILAGFRDQAQQAGVELTWRGEERTFPLDAEKLGQALGNLVLNALQHSAAGGRVEVTGTVSKQGLAVTVTDSGTGVEPAEVERIFEPFVSSRADGTGLGLTLVREIVEAHGGTARCVPQPVGARFEIHLPWPES